MYTILNCITTEHELGSLAAAIFICSIGAATTFALWNHQLSTSAHRKWHVFVLTVMTAACVVWTTHFVSMIGYVYGLGQEISIGWTLSSLAIAIGCYAIATLAMLNTDRGLSSKLRAALMLTAAVGTMHYTGIQAYRKSATLLINSNYILLSLGICFAFNLGAVSFFSSGMPRLRGIGTSLCFSFGVLSLHFTGMAGLTLVPFNGSVDGMTTPAWLTPVLVLTVTFIVAGGAIALVMDRRQMRRNVDEARRLHDVLQQAPFPTTMESQDGSWRRHNLAMTRFLGVASSENNSPSVNLPLEDFIDNCPPSFGQFPNQGDGESETIGRTETTFRRPDGDTRIGQVTRSLICGAGVAPNILVTQILDVTEAKQIEIAKSNFVSTVSHELRTPLTSVRSAVGMIRGTRGPDSDPTERRLLDIAESNCQRLLALINDLLDMDRLARGNVEFDFQRFEAGDLCESVVEDLMPYAKSLGVDVACMPHETGLYARTDAKRFSQVLSNLVSNAVKFTKTGSMVRIALATEDAKIKVSVSDAGPGISPDFAPHVFDRFRQEQASTTRAHAGSGVGLHICKGLVDNLGGEIGFQNNDDVGTTFWFTVPMMGIRMLKDPELDDDCLSQTALPRILHVEDDPTFSEVFQIASGTRAEIITAPSFTAAAAILDSQDIDLLLVDWELPDGSGVDLLAHKRIAGSTIPVVSLSSSADTRRSSRTHFDIVKSEFSMEQVCEVVMKILEDQAQLRQNLRAVRQAT